MPFCGRLGRKRCAAGRRAALRDDADRALRRGAPRASGARDAGCPSPPPCPSEDGDGQGSAGGSGSESLRSPARLHGADGMILPDVSVLIYAHRGEVRDHARYRAWLEETVSSDSAFGLSDLVLSGFVRIVTHPRIFNPPSRFSLWTKSRGPVLPVGARAAMHPAWPPPGELARPSASLRGALRCASVGIQPGIPPSRAAPTGRTGSAGRLATLGAHATLSTG